MAGVTVPVIPLAHQYLVTEAVDGVHPDLPQLRDPDNLVYFRRGGAAAWSWAATSAIRRRGRSTAFRPTSTASCCPRTGLASRRSCAGAVRRVPAMADAGVRAADQRPGGLHARQRVHPGRARGARLFRGSRLLRARHCRRRRVGTAGGAVDPRRRAGVRPVEDGHPPLRRRNTARGDTRWPARSRYYATYYDIHYPNEERQAGPSAAALARLRAAGRAGLCVRREVRLGAPELVRRRTQPTATRHFAPAAGRAEHWRAAIGAEALATRQAAALFDETSFSKIEIVGAGRPAPSWSACAPTHGPGGRLHHLHADAATSAAESSATSPSPAWPRSASGS